MASQSKQNTNSSSTTKQQQQQQAEEVLVVADASEWKRQLVTREDGPFHLHKALGAACLLSFGWRCAHIGATDMAFGSHPHLTLPTLLLHWALTASSFRFRIPKQRIRDGTRIWPEYRLHAMVFLCRSLATLALYWYEEQQQQQNHYYDANLAIVVLSMAAADACSTAVGSKYQSRSVRDVQGLPAAVKYFFTIMQFYATAGFLVGLRHRYTFPFLTVMVVQLTPFLGTLRRKNLISARLGAFLYGAFLVASFVVIVFFSPGATLTQMRATASLGFVAAVWRLAPLPHRYNCYYYLQNKYLIWTSLGLLVRRLRPYYWDDVNAGTRADEMMVEQRVTLVFRMGLVAVLVLGCYKINNEDYDTNTTEGKKTV